MIPLAKMALKRKAKVKEEVSEAVDPFKEAMREAFDAIKAGDFDGFSTAFESAVDIRMASQHDEDEDVHDDVEPYEIDEMED